MKRQEVIAKTSFANRRKKKHDSIITWINELIIVYAREIGEDPDKISDIPPILTKQARFLAKKHNYRDAKVVKEELMRKEISTSYVADMDDK